MSAATDRDAARLVERVKAVNAYLAATEAGPGVFVVPDLLAETDAITVEAADEDDLGPEIEALLARISSWFDEADGTQP